MHSSLYLDYSLHGTKSWIQIEHLGPNLGFAKYGIWDLGQVIGLVRFFFFNSCSTCFSELLGGSAERTATHGQAISAVSRARLLSHVADISFYLSSFVYLVYPSGLHCLTSDRFSLSIYAFPRNEMQIPLSSLPTHLGQGGLRGLKVKSGVAVLLAAELAFLQRELSESKHLFSTWNLTIFYSFKHKFDIILQPSSWPCASKRYT